MLPTCTTWESCLAHDGQRVRIVGTYTVVAADAGFKGSSGPRLARVVPGGGTRGPFLEPYWDPASERSDAERARFEGKPVVVTGTLYVNGLPSPEPDMGTVGGACVHPVESVEPLR